MLDAVDGSKNCEDWMSCLCQWWFMYNIISLLSFFFCYIEFLNHSLNKHTCVFCRLRLIAYRRRMDSWHQSFGKRRASKNRRTRSTLICWPRRELRKPSQRLKTNKPPPKSAAPSSLLLSMDYPWFWWSNFAGLHLMFLFNSMDG